MKILNVYIRCLNRYSLFIALLLCLPFLTTAQNTILLYTLQEELPNNTLIADISTASGIKDELSPEVIKQLKYSFLDTPSIDMNGHESKQYFKIIESKGLLKTSKAIDRDEICPKQPICTFTLEIAISPAQYFRIITVSIDIIDINDNKPRFIESSIAVNVIESAQVNSVVALLPSGFDPDSDLYGIGEYKLQTLNPDTHTQHRNVFSLQQNQGLDGSMELKLILLKPLDRERVVFYQLQVTAYEGVVDSQTGTVLVNVTILDTNDNPPVFNAESYSVDIPENTPVDSTITKVSAYDADIGANGHVIFGFTSRTKEYLGDTFGIDPNSGDIFIKNQVDYETDVTYQLVVTASDKGSDTLTTQVAVLVNVLDVNDYQPQITINSLSDSGQPEVLEHVQKGTFIAYVSVIDLDSGLNGQVTCWLNTTNFQLIEMQKSRYTVVTDAIFDREIIDKYTTGLTCEDKGTPTLSSTTAFTVNILDVNDHPPIFQKSLYVGNLEENNSPNAFLFQVNATDKDVGYNGLVYFGLSPSNSKDLNSLFEMDTNGVLRATGILDHEQYETVTFGIFALDRGQPALTATAQVSIEILDVNDCKPRFTVPAYSFGLYENELPGVNIGNVVAIDEDGEPYNKVSYRLEADDYHTLENFRINASNGLIKSEYSLDREKETTYYLKVIAFNPGFPGMSGSTSVTIYVSDDNDNSPIIDFPTVENNTVYVNDNVKPGYVITRIRANDLDTGENARLSYELIKVIEDNTNYSGSKKIREGGKEYKDGGIMDTLFNLDKITGALNVMAKLPLSTEINRYKLDIGVKDRGYPNSRITTTYLTVICEHGVGTGLINHHDDYDYTSDNIDSVALTKKRMPNLTIVIAVACGSTLVIVIIILLIILLSYRGKKGRRAPQQQGQYNCRVEAQRMLNGNIGRARPASSPTHSTDCEEHTHPDYQHTALNHDDSGRGLSISDQMPEPDTVGQHRSWIPHNQRQQNVKPSQASTNTCVVTLENNDQFSTRLMPLTDKEIEIHKIVKFLHSQQDHDSHFDSMSTSDSGKGASDNGDLVADAPDNSLNKRQGNHHYSAAPTHHYSYLSNHHRLPLPDAIHGYQIGHYPPSPAYNCITIHSIAPKSLYINSMIHNVDNPLYSVVNKPSKQVTFSTTLPKQSDISNHYTTLHTQGGNTGSVKSQMSTFSSSPRQTKKVVDNRGFERKIIKPLNNKPLSYKETSFYDNDSPNLGNSDNKQNVNIAKHSKYGGIGVVRPMQNKQVDPITYDHDNNSIKQPADPTLGVNNNQQSLIGDFPPPPPPYKHSDGSTDSVSLNWQLSDAESLTVNLEFAPDSVV